MATLTDKKTDYQKILAVAKGEAPADLVLKGGKVFNSFCGTWDICDIAIADGIVVGCGTYNGKKEIDVKGKYITPGLLDAHMHIESTMLAPRELAKLLLLNGVTTIFADPHEIVNVLGTEGMNFMLEETEDLPLDVFFMAPSCVPATMMETSGAVINADDIQQMLKHERVLGLGEMMNYPGVLFADEDVLAKLETVVGGICDGHAPGLSDKCLNAYCAMGIYSEHEATTAQEALERLKNGMYIMLRESSGAHNLLDLLEAVTAANSRRCCLATDDRHLDDLIAEGSINYMIEIGVTHGYPAETLLQMATLNAAERFRMYDRGAIAPGYKADLNVFDDLHDFTPRHVIKNGTQVVRNGKLLWQGESVINKPAARMNVGEISEEELQIPQSGEKARVIKLVPEQIFTEELIVSPKAENVYVVSDTQRDILKLAVWERHHATGNVGLGLVHGFGLKKGALASTVAHDSHNLIVVGTNDADMVLAAQTLKDCGGIAVAVDGEIKALLPLPIAGLMSDQSIDYVNRHIKQMEFWKNELGCSEELNAFMILSFLALPVIPKLKLTDKGLFNVEKFAFAKLFVD